MKTIFDLPVTISQRVDRLARKWRQTRSEILAAAVAEYVARHDPEAATDALNRLAKHLDTRLDPQSAAAARRALERAEW